MTDFDRERERMSSAAAPSRIGDERVLEAMAAVPRERFVGNRFRRRAYADGALPIGDGQTISQPWVVAAICEGLAAGRRAGAGDRDRVRLFDRDPGPASPGRSSASSGSRRCAVASERLRELGAGDVEVRVADGTLGAPDRAI